MIARSLETSYLQSGDQPVHEQFEFWLREMRTPTLLIEVATRFPAQAQHNARHRPLLELAIATEERVLADALHAEERGEREADRQYWLPLRAELERLRQARRSN